MIKILPKTNQFDPPHNQYVSLLCVVRLILTKFKHDSIGLDVEISLKMSSKYKKTLLFNYVYSIILIFYKLF